MSTSSWRGNKIFFRENEWFYEDTKEKVSDDPNICCGYCKQTPTVEGYDACLGTLPNIMNACCGHGVEEDTYVQFYDGSCIRGREAIKWIEVNKDEAGMKANE